MKVFVTGAAGQLGHDVVAVCSAAGDEVIGADLTELDVTSRDAVHAAIAGLAPDVVINCASYNAVDAAETDLDKAFAVNAMAVRHLTEATSRAGAHLVHVSTDYVFDGEAGRPYVEWDATNPMSVYGRSKRGGELEVTPEATVVRTSWLCGRYGPGNFVKTMLRLAAEQEELTVVDDQFGSPTFTSDLAGAVRLLGLQRRPGLHHVTNAGETSWFGFATDILSVAGQRPERVRPIATAELLPARPAHRPAYSVLDNAALRTAGLPLLADYHEPLERLVKDLLV